MYGMVYKDTQYYYLPGDKLRIIVYSPKTNYLQLQIEVLRKINPCIFCSNKEKWMERPEASLVRYSSQGHAGNNGNLSVLTRLIKVQTRCPAIMTIKC